MKKLFLLGLISFLAFTAFTQSLPRSTPEAEGISSEAIQQYIEKIDPKRHELHSYMLIRHGKVVSEAWWKPYAADKVHSMYSVSKSWTSTAIGFAVAEKKLSVQDKVISFFPEYADLKDKPFMQDLRVQDLLTMSVGHDKEPLRSVIVMQPDWIRGFLNHPIVAKPGTKFLYNTLATYMLSAIIQKVTGETTLAYLKPRLLDPLHITGIDWESDQKGINVGGWGIRVKTEDMAKLGLLYLNKGKFEGKQILPAAWVEEATSKHIDQEPEATAEKRVTGQYADWIQGYGYQFWRSRHNSFRGDGAFGQYILMMPEQDAVLIITSESQDLPDDLNQVWQNLLPAFQSKALAPNPKALAALKQFNASRNIEAPISSIAHQTLSKSIALEKNQFDFARMQMQTTGDAATLIVTTKDSTQHTFKLGFRTWGIGKSNLVGPYMLRAARVDLAKKAPFDYAGSYRILEDQSIEITLRYFESPHHWTFTWKPDAIEVVNSFEPSTTIAIKRLDVGH
ncbi:serine hydrolase domain-containing protein [Aquirufa sp. TARAVU-A1A]